MMQSFKAFLVAFFAGILLLSISDASEPDAGKGYGSISGLVKYQPDVKRQWRYGRYYLKNGKSGELAGALVCLSGKGLQNVKSKNRKPKKWQMDQKNFEYLPEILAIMAGDKVEFLNSDQTLHNVFAPEGKESFNVMTPVGKSVTRKFSNAGNEGKPINIQCSLHSQMHAWIYVFDHPFAVVTKADGNFELRNIPSGDYDLIVIHPSGRLRKKQKVVVEKGGKKVLELVVSPDDLIGESK